MELSYLENSRAKEICDIIEENGYLAYCVGGCVRDVLRGQIPHDFDITTSALPEQVAEMFVSMGCKVISTGVAHGTVTVLYCDEQFEITTMRCDSDYGDNRHPDSVTFVRDITLDLSRRDFTMNAIAYSFSDRKLIDPFGGARDIEQRMIRSVRDPSLRFEEDSLRILRALRFSSQLGYTIESDTATAMREKKDLILHLSSERIYSEIIKLLCGKNAGKTVYDHYDIMSVVIPQLSDCYAFHQHSRYHCHDVLRHICEVIDNIPPKKHLRLAALFHDLGKPDCFSLDDEGAGHFYGHSKISADIAESVLNRLKSDKLTTDQVVFLVKHHDTPLPKDELLIKKRISKIGDKSFFDLLLLAKADCLGQDRSVRCRLADYDEIADTARRVIESADCLNINKMKINGHDIILMGVGEGKRVGQILSTLFDMVINNRVENEHDSLCAAAKKLIADIRDGSP